MADEIENAPQRLAVAERELRSSLALKLGVPYEMLKEACENTLLIGDPDAKVIDNQELGDVFEKLKIDWKKRALATESLEARGYTLEDGIAVSRPGASAVKASEGPAWYRRKPIALGAAAAATLVIVLACDKLVGNKPNNRKAPAQTVAAQRSPAPAPTPVPATQAEAAPAPEQLPQTPMIEAIKTHADQQLAKAEAELADTMKLQAEVNTVLKHISEKDAENTEKDARKQQAVTELKSKKTELYAVLVTLNNSSVKRDNELNLTQQSIRLVDEVLKNLRTPMLVANPAPSATPTPQAASTQVPKDSMPAARKKKTAAKSVDTKPKAIHARLEQPNHTEEHQPNATRRVTVVSQELTDAKYKAYHALQLQ